MASLAMASGTSTTSTTTSSSSSSLTPSLTCTTTLPGRRNANVREFSAGANQTRTERQQNAPIYLTDRVQRYRNDLSGKAAAVAPFALFRSVPTLENN
ncbi:hypothetical protein M0804_013698 [Polistes exclamans]|nr:hypothetical protein M0804_013698 [Polistes exclamans]